MSILAALMQPAAPSRREQLLRLAMELMSLAEDTDENGYAQKDGTGPEIYVAPRVSPSP